MKLWILRPSGANLAPWSHPYDKAFGHVVRAADEMAARQIAASKCGDEGMDAWLSEPSSICVELIPAGDPGIVMTDFNAG